eukprot:3838442-Amphidinium_carterae.1
MKKHYLLYRTNFSAAILDVLKQQFQAQSMLELYAQCFGSVQKSHLESGHCWAGPTTTAIEMVGYRLHYPLVCLWKGRSALSSVTFFASAHCPVCVAKAKSGYKGSWVEQAYC